MNFFLLLIILCMGGGGYYEYTLLQQQLTDLDSKVVDLETKNKELQDDKDKLTKTVTDDEAKFASATSPTPAPAAAPAAAAPAAKAPVLSNLLGNITTLDGKSYQNCRLLKVDPDGIVVNHSDGILKINFGLLPPDMKTRFGYNPAAGPNLPDDMVVKMNQMQQAAGD
jgi:hypothetical protein